MTNEIPDYPGADQLDFSKSVDGLLPVIVQDATSLHVLMLGFMNAEAYKQTIETGLVTFYSRSKQRLWVKGETSKNYLHVKTIKADCDADTILIKASADGPVCHTGSDTCFNESNQPEVFITQLEQIISRRVEENNQSSYVNNLFQKGINAVAQKVGEEAVELVIEAKDNDDIKFVDEAADLLFHYLILLKKKNVAFKDVEEVLKQRHANAVRQF